MKLSTPVLVSGIFAFFGATLAANALLTNRLLDARQVASPQVVTVDAAEALMWFAQSRPADISDEEWAAQVVSLNSRIGPAVNLMSEQNGVVVLNSAAVLTGAPNFTPQLMQILAAQGASQ